MPKRKSSSAAIADAAFERDSLPIGDVPPPPLKQRASRRKSSQPAKASTNPDKNANVLDGPEALRASPDADEKDERIDVEAAGMDVGKQIKKQEPAPAGLQDSANTANVRKKAPKTKAKKTVEMELRIEAAEEPTSPNPAKPTKATTETSAKGSQFLDPEADGEEEAGEEELQEALSRPPPVNSDYLPLPWKGRLGYACLNTYLRFSNPPIFSSRTCRIASIIENRHPLKDPNAPPHATKNRPDREKPASIRRGQEFVESLGKANARDIVKMLRWNNRYGIKFMRLSSEMFPFASHPEYGYKLEPFVSKELAEAGSVAAELGHRLTTHPGQYTQLGSPRKSVIDNALRDLDYHAELLDLLKLPPQQDRDAVMILHLGGVFGDKEATLNRFRENYSKLPANVKKRLVLENDDVSWSVHELLPLCEELNIPMVLDFHHHNIIFDKEQIREGTKDIVDLYPRILATWKRKNITPKMHYSEPTPAAITGRQRRKHNPRVATLPPCPSDMDLMIEAKDKEQAVFELMRIFKLPGYDTFNDILPHIRKDDNKPFPVPKKKIPIKKSKKLKEADDADDAASVAEERVQEAIPEEEVGMGGPEGRVYWPTGQEDWLRPVKRVIKPKEPKAEGEADKKLTPAQKKKAAAEAAKEGAKVGEEVQATGIKPEVEENDAVTPAPSPASKKKAAPKKPTNGAKKRKKREETPVITEEEDGDVEMEIEDLSDKEDDDERPKPKKGRRNATRRPSVGGGRRRSGRAKQIKYAVESDTEDV